MQLMSALWGFFIQPSKKLPLPAASSSTNQRIDSHALSQRPSGCTPSMAIHCCPSQTLQACSMGFSYRDCKSLKSHLRMTVILTLYMCQLFELLLVIVLRFGQFQWFLFAMALLLSCFRASTTTAASATGTFATQASCNASHYKEKGDGKYDDDNDCLHADGLLFFI